MYHFIGLIVGIGILYLWLRGYLLGWILALPPAFWAAQMFLGEAHADEPLGMIWRAVVVLAATGIPCLLWGTASKRRNK
jgi:hypothetical protein